MQLGHALALLACAAPLSCSGGDVVVGRREASSAPSASPFVPIGVQNVNDSRLSSANFRALLRFVPRADIAIDRVYFGFKLQGAECWDPAPEGNGAGDGGVLHGSLFDIDPATGLPAALIDEETVGACSRHLEAEAESGATPVLGWITASATLERGRMYGLVIDNAHADPARHFFSFQMPIADAALAGPQARNELRADAQGSIMSLDPREHVAWSRDGGGTYLYGPDNGEYASFVGAGERHPATRIPQYGFRLQSGALLPGQPYYAYRTECRDCSVLYAATHAARRFTELGGFTASESPASVGTLTLSAAGTTTSCTPEPGYGFRTCQLDRAIDVAAGESYAIHATGSVELLRLDQQQRALFPEVGSAESDLRASQPAPAPGTHEQDVPSLWAGPVSAPLP